MRYLLREEDVHSTHIFEYFGKHSGVFWKRSSAEQKRDHVNTKNKTIHQDYITSSPRLPPLVL